MQRRFLLAIALLLWGQAQATTSPLFSSINQRLSHMPQVALYKAQHKLPIEDISREKRVLAQALLAAEKAGLESQSVSAFFEAQIAAAKAIQYRYRAELLSRTMPPNGKDLTTQIRPALIRLGTQIIKQLTRRLQKGQPISQQDWPAFEQAVQSPYLIEADKRALFSSLLKIRLKQKRQA